MNKAYIVTGNITDVHTVILDEALPLKPMQVRLVIEPLSQEYQRKYKDVIAEIRERQLARGYKSSKKEEVDAYLQSERESWEE